MTTISLYADRINKTKGNYFLLSKVDEKKFTEYKGSVPRLSSDIPYTYDEVILQNKNNQQDIRKITTFRDSQGRITKRIFDYFKKPLRYRLYENDNYLINENELADKTKINDLSLTRNIAKDFNTYQNVIGEKLAKLFFTERNYTRHNYTSSDIFSKNPKKILSSVIITPKKNFFEVHEFKEYTPNGNHLRVRVDTTNFKTSTNNKGVKNDKFLALRAYDMEYAKIPLVRYFLNKHGLQNAEIAVEPQYLPDDIVKELTMSAFFSDEKGTINFNKLYPFKSKAQLARSSAHECEHAWQYYLYARLTGGDTPFLEKMYKKFGPLTDRAQIAEAETYLPPIENYVGFDENFNKYYSSLIENLARKKGNLAEYEYNVSGTAIRDMFKHIPPELL